MTLRRRLLAAVITPALAGALLFAGCAAPADLDRDAASAMRDTVHTVAEQASAGDAAAALRTLAEVEASLAAGRADGTIGAERADAVQSAIDLVRADLEALIPSPAPAPTQEPGPTPSESSGDDDDDDDGGNDDQGNGNGED